MVVELTLLFTSAIAILALPWALKTADMWNKDIKKWYSILMMGFLVGILSLGLTIYETATISTYIRGTTVTYLSYLDLLLETIAVILAVIGTLGIILRVWTSR